MLLKKSGGFEARDPWVIYHNGHFYHCFTVGAEALFVACAEAPEKLIDAKGVCVFKPEAGLAYSKELWAPELHVIDGKCYIYVACDDGDNYHHRMYVLTNDSPDPTIPYHMVGKIADTTDKWAIDGTVWCYQNEMYMLWSGWEGDVNVCQHIYIAKMRDPFTIASPRVRISSPEYVWERMDCDGVELPYINEGPCVYEKDGAVKVIYSASGSWANHYCLGILNLNGGDPLEPANWQKQEYPALSLEDGWNGPGHCSITSDGKTDYIAFHTYDEGSTRGWNHVHAVLDAFEIVDGKIVLKG